MKNGMASGYDRFQRHRVIWIYALISVLSMTWITLEALAEDEGRYSDVTLRKRLKEFGVNQPSGCSVTEKYLSDRSPNEVFEKPSACRESDFKNRKWIEATVYRVVDGDTIHIYYKNKLYATRMLGIDTPELHFYGRAQPYHGLRARDHLRRLVSPGDVVKVVFDQKKCDRYQRMLVHIYKGNLNLNFEQVKSGWAANYCILPNQMFCQEYGNAYRSARIQRVGFHQDACMVTPYVWRRVMMNKPLDKRVQDRNTFVVYPASQYHKVAVEDRLFLSDGMDPLQGPDLQDE